MVIKHKSKEFLSNSVYLISSNVLSLIVSVLIVLILPKVIGIKEYGYWQLYLFYISYIGFLHLGWVDGIYLKYGGRDYESLEKSQIFSQFFSLLLFQIIVAIIIYFGAVYFVEDKDKVFIISMLSFALVITNVRFLFIYILQATNRIKESSWITLTDRFFYVFLIVLFLLVGFNNYKLLIFADMFGRALSLVLAIYFCKDMIFFEISKFTLDFSEIYDNVKVGSNLMISNICSMLIIGVARFGIEYKWDIETFGKISLIFSISAFLMIFINAVSVVLFPLLKRMDIYDARKFFVKTRGVFVILMLGLLFCYYPIKMILSEWLTEYSDKMVYMSIVFPIAIYEGKVVLLFNTYFKSLRLEKTMLNINFSIMLLSAFFTYLSISLFDSLTLVILIIIVSLILRSIIFEYVLSKKFGVSFSKTSFFEALLILYFIYINFTMDLVSSCITYSILLTLYILLFKRNIILQYICRKIK